MLRRLQKSESKYPSDKFEKEFKKNFGYVKNHCLLPVKDPIIKKYTQEDFLNKKTKFRSNSMNKSQVNWGSPNKTSYKFNSAFNLTQPDFNRNNKNNIGFNNTMTNLKKSDKNNFSITNYTTYSYKNTINNTSNTIMPPTFLTSYTKLNNKTTKNFYKPNKAHSTSKPKERTNSNDKKVYNSTMSSNFKASAKSLKEQKESRESFHKVVYSRKVYINKLGLCDVIFRITDNKFYITINPFNLINEYIFTIAFNDELEINKIAILFKNYEELINYIVYDGISINFKNKVKDKLNYVRHMIIIIYCYLLITNNTNYYLILYYLRTL